LTDPIWEYLHEISRCSITGGYVYRGCAIPDLQGAYLYGDYCSGEIWALTQTNGTVTGVTNLDTQIGRNNFDLVSFGEDYFGEMYMCNLNSGTVVKIVPTGPAFSCGPCCVGITGNVDNSTDQSIDVGDLTSMVQFLFLDGATICMGEANTDGSLDGNVDIGDLTRLIDFLFLTSAPLGSCL
jgi:hypothetical protein